MSRKRFRRILTKLQLHEAGITFRIRHSRGSHNFEVLAKLNGHSCSTIMQGGWSELEIIGTALVLAADAVALSRG